MAEVKEAIEVEVPVSTAYNQWTQFEEFPQFMSNVESVQQIDEARLRWVAEVNGNREEWTAEITQQEPDSVIAWQSTEGPSGEVNFQPAGDSRTRVEVRMTWQPEGMTEELGAKLGRDNAAVKADLERFKELVEGRGQETGAWRGEIQQGERTS